MMSDTNFLFCFALANRWTSMFPLMDDPALCLRDFCSRLQMSGRSYPRITKPRSSLFVGMTEARTHFEESHGQICFGSNFFCLGGGATIWSNSSQVLIPFLTFFPNLTVLWLLFCGGEEASTFGKWLELCQTALVRRGVLNGNVTASLSSLFYPHISPERIKQPWSKPLLANSVILYFGVTGRSLDSNKASNLVCGSIGSFIGISYQLAKYLSSRKTDSDLPLQIKWITAKLSILHLLCIMHSVTAPVWYSSIV